MCKLYFVETLNNFDLEFPRVCVSNRTTKKFYGFDIIKSLGYTKIYDKNLLKHIC